MKRLYEAILRTHFKEDRQMIFIMGPRQVGKTFVAQSFGNEEGTFYYYNWDNIDHRMLILEGPKAIAEEAGLAVVGPSLPVIIFDEIHRFDKWKSFLKGFFDTYGKKARIVVTGSARLDVFQKGGDSLMGRYFPYRMHPLSIGEIARCEERKREILPPKTISDEAFESLWNFGGFPQPFLRSDERHYQRWSKLRSRQLIREDIRDISQVFELTKIEVLTELLKRQVGQLTTYHSLGKRVQASDKTIRYWLSILCNLYFCFEVRPWSKNVSRSLLKEPKYYLWDWTLCKDIGARAENFVASHLLKAIHYWTDMGFGDFGLFFLRDKSQREIDFLVTKNNQPWFLIEVKNGGSRRLSSSLLYYYEMLQIPHAFQASFSLPYVEKDCFSLNEPMIVPARTLLSQLI